MFIPARIPPHKPVEHEPGPEHRLELCRLAVADDDRFEVSDIELRRDGPSYTVDTLEELTLESAQHRALPDRRRRHRRRPAGLAGAGAGAGAGDAGDRQATRHRARRGRDCARRAARRRAGTVLPDATDRRLVDDDLPPRAGRSADPLLRTRPGSRLHRSTICTQGRIYTWQRARIPMSPRKLAIAVITPRQLAGDRRTRRRPQGARNRPARPARDDRLHGLLRDLQRAHRSPDEGDPRRDPPGHEARSRPAATAGRGLGRGDRGS